MEATRRLWAFTNNDAGMLEDECRQEAENYKKNMCKAVKNMEAYGEECDVYDAVRLCIRDSLIKEKYLVKNVKDVQVYDSDNILYDEYYYYIPDKMLKHMCKRILGCVTFLQLKKEMGNIGMIECGKGTKNYTVKKLLPLSGERKRFIKILKECLVYENGLGLENYSFMENKSFENKELA